MLLCIVYLKRNNFIFDFRISSFKEASVKQLKLILKIGIPTSIQNVAISTSFLFLTALVNSISVTASAAVGAVGKLNGFAILPGVAMSTSVSAMAAQNIGAGKYDRARNTMFVGMAIATLISGVIFAFVAIFPEYCIGLFGEDAELIKCGVEYMKAFKYDYFVAPLCFCFNGLFIGAGKTKFSLVNGIMSSLLFRIPASWLFGMVMNMGLYGVGLGAPIASGASLLFCVIFYLCGKWKSKAIQA